MEVTVYGGASEIGGNKILLKENDARIFLDFGISFKKTSEFFEFPLLQPANIDDLLKTGLIPELRGLYRYHDHDAVYGADGPRGVLENLEERRHDAVLLSHAHMDHYGYIGLLRADIPIYLSKISKKIIELYSRAGRTEFHAKIDHLQFENLEKCSQVEVKDLRITRFDVDHSIVGASAYFIQGKKNLVYTGDFRMHGNQKHLTDEFLRQVEKEDVDYLLCEGTRVGQDKNEEAPSIEENTTSSEADVKNECIEIIESEEHLIIYDASQADLERVKILHEVAKKTGRELVIDSKKAYMILHLNEDERLMDGLPQKNDFKILLGRSKLSSNQKLYKELTKTCPGFYLETRDAGRKNHERELLDDTSISPDNFIWGPELRENLLKDSNEYILYTSNGPLLLLHCGTCRTQFSGTYIYGKAEPFNEEMEFTFNRLLKWLDLCNLKLAHAHTTGHCYPADLKDAIATINPKHVISIHTEHPLEFKNLIPTGCGLIAPGLFTPLTLN